MTERTRLRRHQTGRQCFECGAHLRDTIVHFGEKGCLEEPLNWQGAFDKAKVADCILCLGSSLKVRHVNELMYSVLLTGVSHSQSLGSTHKSQAAICENIFLK